jgi:hypothetical protein
VLTRARRGTAKELIGIEMAAAYSFRVPDNDPRECPSLLKYEIKEKHALRGRAEEFRAFALDRSLALHQSAYLLCGDWHLAHDLVQDTLVKVYRHWPRVRQADSPDAGADGESARLQ